jgi:hypothetical protein
MVLLVKGGMSRIVYGVIGVLVVAVVVLTGLVGYWYGQGFQTATVTTTVTSQTTTVTTTTQTRIITVTSTDEFTKFEKLEITSYAKSTDVIVLIAKNTGSLDATITDIFINGKPLSSVGGISAPTLPISLPSGSSTIIILTFTPGFPSGFTASVTVQTASGTHYPGIVVFP